jgi:hypothetical protein
MPFDVNALIEQLVRLVGYLVWPAAVLIIVAMLRKPLRRLLRNLAGRVTDLKSVTEDAVNEAPVVPAEVEKLIDKNPNQAVEAAARRTNRAVRGLVERLGTVKLGEISGRNRAELPQDLRYQLDQLTRLRDAAEQRPITPEDAEAFAVAAAAVEKRVEEMYVLSFVDGPHAGETKVFRGLKRRPPKFTFPDGAEYRETGGGHSVGAQPIRWSYLWNPPTGPTAAHPDAPPFPSRM